MPGIDINQIPCFFCPVCRNKCNPLDETIYSDGRWYHERCYTHKIGAEIDTLEKKASKGIITLEEATELRSLKILYINLKTQKKGYDIRKKAEPPKFIGNTQIALLSAANRKKPRTDIIITKQNQNL